MIRLAHDPTDPSLNLDDCDNEDVAVADDDAVYMTMMMMMINDDDDYDVK